MSCRESLHERNARQPGGDPSGQQPSVGRLIWPTVANRPARGLQKRPPQGRPSQRGLAPASLPVLGNHFGEINNALAIAPLVVVPGDYFYHIAIHHHGEIGIHNRGFIRAGVVRRDEG
jgi:hypothetical protein